MLIRSVKNACTLFKVICSFLYEGSGTSPYRGSHEQYELCDLRMIRVQRYVIMVQ